MRCVDVALVAWAISLPSGAVLLGCELDFDKYRAADAVALDTTSADQDAELDDNSVGMGDPVPDGYSVAVEANSPSADAGEVDAQPCIDVADALATSADATVPVGDASARVGDVSVVDGRVGDAGTAPGDASSNSLDGRIADVGTATGDGSLAEADGRAADGSPDAEEPADASHEAAACAPSSSCLTTAGTCASTCTKTYDQCAKFCILAFCQACTDTEQTCLSQCTTTCTSCTTQAGCPAPAACLDAGAGD
jgi:hypothetical protein